MNALQDKYRDDFVILGFPCNQFNKEEPGANATEIMNGIKYVRPGNNFEPNFPLFDKIDVNGEDSHPLYTWLKDQCEAPEEAFRPVEKLHYKGFHARDVRWNWEKFLVDRTGKPYKRFMPALEPHEFDDDVAFLVKK